MTLSKSPYLHVRVFLSFSSRVDAILVVTSSLPIAKEGSDDPSLAPHKVQTGLPSIPSEQFLLFLI